MPLFASNFSFLDIWVFQLQVESWVGTHQLPLGTHWLLASLFYHDEINLIDRVSNFLVLKKIW